MKGPRYLSPAYTTQVWWTECSLKRCFSYLGQYGFHLPRDSRRLNTNMVIIGQKTPVWTSVWCGKCLTMSKSKSDRSISSSNWGSSSCPCALSRLKRSSRANSSISQLLSVKSLHKDEWDIMPLNLRLRECETMQKRTKYAHLLEGERCSVSVPSEKEEVQSWNEQVEITLGNKRPTVQNQKRCDDWTWLAFVQILFGNKNIQQFLAPLGGGLKLDISSMNKKHADRSM